MKKRVGYVRQSGKFFQLSLLLCFCATLALMAVCSHSLAQGGNRITDRFTGQNNKPLFGVSGYDLLRVGAQYTIQVMQSQQNGSGANISYNINENNLLFPVPQ